MSRGLALTTGVVLVGGLAYVGIGDPHRPGFLFPPCPMHALTGWFCPGCGGMRMTHDVLNGEFGAAIQDNAFALFGLPLLLGWLVVRRRQGRPLMPLPAIAVIAVAVITWTVVRNLPGFPLVPTSLGG